MTKRLLRVKVRQFIHLLLRNSKGMWRDMYSLSIVVEQTTQNLVAYNNNHFAMFLPYGSDLQGLSWGFLLPHLSVWLVARRRLWKSKTFSFTWLLSGWRKQARLRWALLPIQVVPGLLQIGFLARWSDFFHAANFSLREHSKRSKRKLQNFL